MDKYTYTRNAGTSYASEGRDVEAVAIDLAAAMGLDKDSVTTYDGMTACKRDPRRIILPGSDGTYILVCSNEWRAADKGKISLSLRCTAAGKLHHSERPNLPATKCTLSQPMERIARTVQRKLIDAGAPMVADIHRKAKASDDTLEAMRATVERYAALYPHWSIGKPERDHFSVTVYGRGWHGRLHNNGAVTIGRTGQIASDDIAALVAILERAA